ncbi:unnamed protein product [Adineta ricciae]|uniref:Uncharacterized protein n=1 Tax=Adineta ricciae TaxID=249248 RepID=A0A815GBJ8_ADIRI|nr:unnamed protein product [Adineta ricciae]
MARQNRSDYDDEESGDEMYELNEIFSKFKDDPREDCIRVKHLTEVIQALGRNPSMKDAEERIDELEAIGKYELTLDDILQILREPWTVVNNDRDDLRHALERFKHEHDDYIDVERFSQAMSTLGEPLAKREVDDLIRLGLTNDQKKIDIEYLLVQLLGDNA